jgi:CRISPR-associated protein Cmr1
MFLGSAYEEAEWRAAPFKGMLRYWWRITRRDIGDFQTLLEQESKFFGSAGDSKGVTNGKSLVSVSILSKAASSKEKMKKTQGVHHPECKIHDVDPLLYLANMGLLDSKGNIRPGRSYFPVDSEFKINISYPPTVGTDINKTLALVQAFSVVGARSRNGWGSFAVKPEATPNSEILKMIGSCTTEWTEGFKKDYPNCLGQDAKGPLFWKTKQTPNWEEAMRELAGSYIGVRAREIAGIPKLDPDHKDHAAERHLLGVPLTHHPAARMGWKSDRHASPLRFMVRKNQGGFHGFILHVPYRFSDEMKFMSGEDQLTVWKKVHHKLDALDNLKRARYEECL